MKKIGIVGVPNPMRSLLLHDLTEIQKIERDIASNLKNDEFKKKINSKPRRKR